MIFPEKVIVLRNGTPCTLRSAAPSDSEDMIAFLTATAGESHYLMKYPEEVHLSVEQESALLTQMASDEHRGCMLIAVIDSQIVGSIGVYGIAERIKTRHRSSFGITVRANHWGKGIGRVLLENAMDFARSIGFTQMELGVYADNGKAIALYESLGFETWGRIHNAFILKDGTSIDEITMGRSL